jgi:hypothetical protein
MLIGQIHWANTGIPAALLCIVAGMNEFDEFLFIICIISDAVTFIILDGWIVSRVEYLPYAGIYSLIFII